MGFGGGGTSGSANVITRANPKKGQFTIIEGFQAGHGFVRVAGDATLSDDTTEYALGVQSLKIVCPTGNANNQIENAAIAPTLDITDTDVCLLVKWTADNAADDADDWGGLTWRMGQNFGNRYQYDLINGDINTLQENEWGWIQIPFSKLLANTTGGPTEAAIDYVSFNTRNGSGVGTMTYWINAIATVPRLTAGKIIIRMDDSPNTHYTEAMRYLNFRNIKGNFSLIPTTLSGGTDLTVSQALQIQAAGHMIITHTGGNLVNDATSQAGVEALINAAKSASLNLGFKGNDVFVLPQGAFFQGTNNFVLPATLKYFAANITGIITENIGNPLNWNTIKSMLNIDATTTQLQITDAIDEAMLGNAVCVVLFHRIVVAGPVGVETTQAIFRGVIDHIFNNHAGQTVTMQEWMDSV